MTLICPACNSTTIKKNGHIHNGKQNHQCLSCSRQFVLNPEKKSIPEEEKAKIRQALLERVSLEGICRIFNISMPWLLKFMDEIIHALPEHLNANVIHNEELEIASLELDEQWSYVRRKKNPQWLWLVFHSTTRQVLAMHVGKRDKESAECLLRKLPEDLKKTVFYTDKFSAYFEVIPWREHRLVGKESGKTSYIERFNNSLETKMLSTCKKDTLIFQEII